MERKATMPVPIFATVSRKTGEIRFTYSDDYMDQVRFGQVMNKLSRIQNAFDDQEAKKAFDAQLEAKMKGATQGGE